MILAATTEFILNELLALEDFALVAITAPHRCEPCARMWPVLNELADETDVTIITVNFDDDLTIGKHLEIDALPTFVLYDQSKEVKRFGGAMSKEEMLSNLKLK